MNLKILGTGCKKCKELEANVRKAVEELGVSAQIEKVEDIKEIMAYGVMSTPALVIDDEVKSMGKVLKSEDVKKLIK